MKARRELLLQQMRDAGNAILAVNDEGKKLASEVDDANTAVDLARARGEHLDEYLRYTSVAFAKIAAFQKFNENLPKRIAEITAGAPEKSEEIKSLKEKMERITSDAETQGKPFADKLATAAMRLQNAALKISEPYPRAETYFSDFAPLVIQKTLTDADGKFSFSYPRNKALTIFAKAEREAGDKKERYFWLVNAPSGVETAKTLLSNNNFVFNDPDGYFKIKPPPETQTKPASK